MALTCRSSAREAGQERDAAALKRKITALSSFAFTVFFDQRDAPLNHAIFGPKFTFTGEMIEGEITIVDPSA